MAIGIPYDVFWHLNPRKMAPFYRAHELHRQEQSNDMWLMGQYVAAALDATVCNAIPFIKRRKSGKYPERPIRIIPLSEEEKQQEEEKALDGFLAFFNSLAKETKQGE